MEDDSDLFDPPRRITFSFDSSGWLYTYHLGVAHYLQQALLGGSGGGGGPSSDFAFSGSSGGALVAGALATGIDIHALASFVISCHGECQYNPWRMFPCTDRALQRFVGQAAHKRANGRLRVLLTRIQLWTLKPAVRPETVSAFGSTQHLKQVLRASCHIPFLAGPLPYHVPRQDAPDGSMLHAGGDFIDGLYWPSVLFMWRQFDRADTLVRVSGIGNPLAAIRPPLPVPLHWVVLPPPPETLWKLFACGYPAHTVPAHRLRRLAVRPRLRACPRPLAAPRHAAPPRAAGTTTRPSGSRTTRRRARRCRSPRARGGWCGGGG